MFESTITNPQLKSLEGYRMGCMAHGCPLGYRVSTQDEAERNFVCDFHRIADSNDWYTVTSRIRANKWLFDLETFCRVRRASNASRFTEEEKAHINKLASSHNCDLLLITDSYNPRCFEYEQRLYSVQLALIIEGKDPEDFSNRFVYKADKPEEDDDFPL